MSESTPINKLFPGALLDLEITHILNALKLAKELQKTHDLTIDEKNAIAKRIEKYMSVVDDYQALLQKEFRWRIPQPMKFTVTQLRAMKDLDQALEAYQNNQNNPELEPRYSNSVDQSLKMLRATFEAESIDAKEGPEVAEGWDIVEADEDDCRG